MTVRRRDLLAGLAGLPPTLALSGRRPRAVEGPWIAFGEPKAFDAAMLREQARALATVPHQSPEGARSRRCSPRSNDDQHRAIRFRPEAALWRGLGLSAEVQLFNLGNRYRVTVHIYEVEGGMAREVLYAPELFDFGGNPFDEGATGRLARVRDRLRGRSARAIPPDAPVEAEFWHSAGAPVAQRNVDRGGGRSSTCCPRATARPSCAVCCACMTPC